MVGAMTISRRELPWLLAAAEIMRGESASVLPSKVYPFQELTGKTNPDTHNESWPVFRGQTHDHFEIACHMTKLQPGMSPHPPHRHVHEEIFFMREGQLDVTIENATRRIGPGSVAYIHSNELHGVRNPGTEPAQYFVLELDGMAKA